MTHTPGREEPYPDHPERFESVPQVVCRESVCERCYWEAEWSESEGGWVYIAVTDKGISRKGGGYDCGFGWNKNSWSLRCDKLGYSVCHNKNRTHLPAPPSPYRRAGVCDGAAGTGVCDGAAGTGVCDGAAGTGVCDGAAGTGVCVVLLVQECVWTVRPALCPSTASLTLTH